MASAAAKVLSPSEEAAGRFRLRPSLHPEASTAPSIPRLAFAHTMASISELTCLYWAFILNNDEVTVMEDKINALIIAASVNVGPFWPGLFAKALALGASSAI